MNIQEFFEEYAPGANMSDFFLCCIGLIIFGIWSLRTHFGCRALDNSRPRRNDMPVLLPFVPFFVWLGLTSILILATQKQVLMLKDWQQAVFNNSVYCVSGTAAILLILIIARRHFARRLRGFGLKFDTIGKDLSMAFVNLFSVWPLIVFMILATTAIGKAIWGPEFEMQRHDELEMLSSHPQLIIKILVVILTVVVAPVLEEMLFRGLIQTMVRSYLNRPWISIFLSAALFAMIHPTRSHWPALFVLAVCLGYSYEKSGSIMRPIFIHAIFNASSVIATMASG